MTSASVCSVLLVSCHGLCLVAILRFSFSATTADSGWVLLKGELITANSSLNSLMTACRKENILREYLAGIGYLAGTGYLVGIGYLAFMTRNYALMASLVIAWKMKHE